MGRNLKRRNARNRLLRYLTRGGRLVKESPLGYCKANRSGEAWPTAMVEKLVQRGWSVGGVSYELILDVFATYVAATTTHYPRAGEE